MLSMMASAHSEGHAHAAEADVAIAAEAKAAVAETAQTATAAAIHAKERATAEVVAGRRAGAVSSGDDGA